MSDDPRHSGLVIGASSGIGAAVVRRLAEPGLVVHAASRRGTHPVESAGIAPCSVDIRSYSEVVRLIEAVARDGKLEFVVNSAGIGAYAPLGADHAEAWRDVVETNVLGAIHVCSALLEVEVEVGQFIHIGSLAAYRLSKTPGNAVYSAAKTAAAVIVDHTRSELRAGGRETRVSTIAPGFVEGTEFGERFFAATPEAAVPLYRPGENLVPEDVAEMAAFALSLPAGVEVSDLLVRPASQA